MDVFLAFNHMFALGTRGLGLIKQLWLAKFLSVITNHRRLPYLCQTCWSPPKKYRRGSFHEPQSKRTVQFTPPVEWPVSESAPLKRCGRLSDWIAPSDGKSLSEPRRAELTTPGCQWRWNVKPLTCILTLCHFDESDWRCLSGDWGRRGRTSWIHNVGRLGWNSKAGEQFYSAGHESLCAYCRCPGGFINVWSVVVLRAGTLFLTVEMTGG